MILPSLLIGTVLLAFFIWKEWAGNFDRHFLVKTFIGLFAILALAAIVLQPSFLKEVNKKGLLLTAGYDETTLDSLEKNIAGLQVINYKKGDNVKRELDSVGEIMILGEGVPSFDFWQIDEHSVRYFNHDLPSGIVKLKYNQELEEGDELTIKGLYHQPTAGNQLILRGYGEVSLDSIVMKDQDNEGFELTTIGKVAGKFLFQLIEKDSSGESISIEPIPVVVKAKEPLKILIINEFPSFETKYLKNFLSEAGHELVVRSQITRRKYKFEYFNRDNQPIYGFTPENINEFDVLIFDSESYFNLSRKSLEIILEHTQNNGLGVFLQPDEKLFKRSSFFKSAGIDLDGDNSIFIKSLPKLKLEKYPYSFSNGSNVRSKLIEDFMFYEQIGRGRLGTMLLRNTYQLVLNGNSIAYHQIWSQIINQLSRKNKQNGELKASQYFAFQNEPYALELQTKMKKPVILHDDGYQIPLIQDAVNIDLWHTKTYPIKKGWHTIRIVLDSSVNHNYYVMDSTKWKSLVSANITSDNHKHFNEAANESKMVIMRHPISRIWFFVCFVLAMGILWLMPKFRN